jgi:hypothetical protein
MAALLLTPERSPMLRAGSLLAAAAIVSLGVADGADAATIKHHVPHTRDRVVSIAAPADHALVRASVVPVRLKVGPKVSAVRVFAGTKDISARFSRRGNAFTARLPRSLFKSGTNTLLVQAKARGGKAGGAARVSIIVPRATKTLNGTAQAASVGADTFSAKPANGLVPVAITSKAPTYARLTVNGRRVEDLRARRALTEHSWLVSGHDGLKVGQNRLAVESWDAKGNRTIKRWTMTRGRSLPLTDVGPHERIVKPGAWTALDASKSKVTQKGAKLSYVWRVISSPKGAKPQLRDATSAKPKFKPGRPGVYKLALRATQNKPGARAAAVAPAAQDVVTVNAAPALGASGLFVDTSLEGYSAGAPPYNKLYIDGTPYATDTNYTDSTSDTFVQLDETTLAVINSGDDASITPTAGTITIGVWFNHGVKYTTDQYGSAIWIGTTQVAYNSSPKWMDPKLGNPTTNLRGWIQPSTSDSDDNATWNDSDMLQVKTREPSDTATTNTVEVNGKTYPQSLSAGQTGGWQLVMLDNNGTPMWNELFPLTGDATADAASEDRLAGVMTGNGGASWILQAFGTVPAVPDTSNLAQTIQQLGGNADVVSRFNGKADSTGGVYSLISGPHFRGNVMGPEADEASFERTGATGSQTALLVRDAGGNAYVPLTGDSATPDAAGSNRYSIMQTAYAPPTDWTNWVHTKTGGLRAPTAGETAALADIVSDATGNHWVPTNKLCPTAPDAIRGYYCTTNATALTTLLTRVSGLKFDSDTAGARYTQDEWNNAQDSIGDEIADVSNIRSSIADYQALFGTANLDGAVDAGTIGDAIKSAITTNATITTNPADARLAAILSALTDMVSIVGDEFGGAMTFLSGAFSLMGTDQPDSSPQAILDDVSVTQDTAAATLTAALQQASEQLSDYGDRLVSDPVKLQGGASYLLNNDPQTSQSDSEFVHTAEYATAQWLWGTMLAPAYTVWEAPNTIGTNPYCANAKAGSVGHPWSDLSATGTWASGSTNWLLGYDSQASNNWGWAVANADNLNVTGLPGSITDKLFGQPISPTSAPSPTTNAGAVMPYFAQRYLQFKPVPVVDSSHWGQPTPPAGCQPY